MAYFVFELIYTLFQQFFDIDAYAIILGRPRGSVKGLNNKMIQTGGIVNKNITFSVLAIVFFTAGSVLAADRQETVKKCKDSWKKVCDVEFPDWAGGKGKKDGGAEPGEVSEEKRKERRKKMNEVREKLEQCLKDDAKKKALPGDCHELPARKPKHP